MLLCHNSQSSFLFSIWLEESLHQTSNRLSQFINDEAFKSFSILVGNWELHFWWLKATVDAIAIGCITSEIQLKSLKKPSKIWMGKGFEIGIQYLKQFIGKSFGVFAYTLSCIEIHSLNSGHFSESLCILCCASLQTRTLKCWAQ